MAVIQAYLVTTIYLGIQSRTVSCNTEGIHIQTSMVNVFILQYRCFRTSMITAYLVYLNMFHALIDSPSSSLFFFLLVLRTSKIVINMIITTTTRPPTAPPIAIGKTSVVVPAFVVALVELGCSELIAFAGSFVELVCIMLGGIVAVGSSIVVVVMIVGKVFVMPVVVIASVIKVVCCIVCGVGWEVSGVISASSVQLISGFW